MRSEPRLDELRQQLSWSQIRGHIVGHRRALVIAHAIALLAMLCSVPVPLLMPLMVDEVLLNQPGPALNFYDRLLPADWHSPLFYISLTLLITVLLRTLSVGLNVLQSRQFTLIAKQLTFQLRCRLLNVLGEVTLQAYETLGAAKVASKLTTDLDTLDRFIGDTLAKLLISVLTVVGTAMVLLWIDWRLGLFILLCNPVVIFFSKQLGKQLKQLKTRENAAYELFQQALVETLDGIQEIRSANQQRHYLLRLADAAKSVRDGSVAYAWRSEAVGRASFLIFLIGFELFRAVAMLMVVFADLTIGQIFAVFGYLWFMMTPVNELLSMQVALQGANAALARLREILDYQTYPPITATETLPDSPPTLRVSNLSFGYRDERPILDRLSFSVDAGHSAAIVGASGGGKSTLVHLLTGAYLPPPASIFYNEIPFESLGRESVCERVATVIQQPTLFNASVRENLSLGRECADSALMAALAVAELADFVEQLPQGLDTQIGARGMRLSGGQRQRLAIARMVLRKPQMVILDEATSALDTETEARVHANLKRFLAGRTCLIIAHRLSAIRQAETIYVFEDGRIAQSGQHDALIKRDGLYRTLYASE